MAENNQAKSNRGGARPGAGRKKGAATTKTREIANRAAESGITPLEYMLQVMRTEPSEHLDERELLQAITLRFEAAKAAAPYIHPRLAAVEHTATVTLKNAKDMTEDELAAIAAGSSARTA